MTGRARDAAAWQPALGDPVRSELVPVRAVRRVDLDDGHAATVARGTDTAVGRAMMAFGERLADQMRRIRDEFGVHDGKIPEDDE